MRVTYQGNIVSVMIEAGDGTEYKVIPSDQFK